MRDEGSKKIREKPNISGDRVNITLLLLMYSFSGVVYGLTLAFPIIFQNRNVSYADQAEFSFATYPTCFKFLWAPIVDCVFSKRFGRRKSWIVPTQYFMGMILLYASLNLDDWLGSEDGERKPQIRQLTVAIFLCTLFGAMQGVSLDGWSLTILQKRNLGYGGICQNIGFNSGRFLAYVGFIILNSKDVCNLFRSVPKDYGFVSFTQFILFWSVVFLASTTFIFVCKKDKNPEIAEDKNYRCTNTKSKLSLMESYEHMWNILKMGPMLKLSLLLLTFFTVGNWKRVYWKWAKNLVIVIVLGLPVAFGPSLGVSHLKIISAGISKDSFVLLTTPAIPCQIILSVVLRRSFTGLQSVHSFILYYILLWMSGILFAAVLYILPFVRDEQKLLPLWYYGALFFIYNARTVFKGLMSLAISAFFSHISDPRYGGMYMTLLNTMTDIGMNWPTTLSLWAVDLLNITHCDEKQAAENVCHTTLDGFYAETAICSVIGAIWLWWGKDEFYKLQRLESSAWIAERGEEKKVVQYETLPVLIDKSDGSQTG